MTVYGFDKDLGDVVRELRIVFGSQDLRYAGGTLALATIRSAGKVLRLVVVGLSQEGQTVLFHLEQSREEYDASSRPPDRHLLAELPQYPGSDPMFFVRDEGTRLSLAVSATHSGQDEIRAFFDFGLPAAGWRTALPPVPGVPAQGLQMFLRGEEICCVFVETGRAGRNRVTLLYKQPGSGR